ncbi:D-alanine transaminase [Mariprofundus ferrinatatus]|uniref:D-alanine transaminase n=1 Tax=Mariprofundus ferrinatatus TaxID=1921087 RepID=A0A2K8L3V9_9PROT|nr:aminotransferase class IV [Mariprofundus ferrinatatus]ATX81792.1 D-alanine transaminase [Mariprofundus ferrinatatus]
MTLTAWVNGRFVPLEEATIHIEDRGFQFADGVYEVIACFGGRFLELEAHLDRLENSCEGIGISLLKSRPELIELIHDTYHRNPFDHAMIYIQATRGIAPRSHLLTQEVEPTLVITARELPSPSAEKLTHGASAITLPDIRWKRCDIKSIALLASVIGKQEAARQGVDEAFWLDDEGHILEGCATNCFAVINGELVTHPLDHHVLGGITRHLALKVAREHDITIVERPWRLDEPGLSECMMSSTTNAVVAVSNIDGVTIGNGAAGPISTNLRQWILDEFEAMKQ